MDPVPETEIGFIEPSKTNFTIYSKSGCPNCTKVKNLLKEKKLIFTIIDCDDYLIEDKEIFLLFIEKYAEREYKTFPMVFENGKFIGGYNETLEKVNIILDFDISF